MKNNKKKILINCSHPTMITRVYSPTRNDYDIYLLLKKKKILKQ